MTACVNRKHSRRVAAVISASLVGALSLGVAPVAAMANSDIELLDVADDSEIWQAGTFDWNVDADAYGTYSVEPGDVFALDSVTDVNGNAVSAGDYAVFYFDNDTTNPVAGTAAINGQLGGMPKAGNTAGYTAVVVKIDGTLVEPVASDTLTGYTAANVTKTQAFKVAAVAQKSLEGAYAFNGTTKDEISDTSWLYTGKALDFSFADAEGNVLTSSDVDVKWIAGTGASGITGSVTDAGTYTAILTAKGTGSYTGSATVSFQVEKLDLSKVSLTMDTVTAGTGITFSDSTAGRVKISVSQVFVDGDEALNGGDFTVEFVSLTKDDGSVETSAAGLTGNISTLGNYTFSVKPTDPDNKNVTGAATTVTAAIVADEADVFYGEDAIATYFPTGTPRVFETSKGEAFDPKQITAQNPDGDEIPATVTVTKDGETVTSYDEPGEYKVNVSVATPANCAYGYNKTFTFKVVSKEITGAITVFATIDGKSAADTFPYTGEAYVPTIVVKEGKKVLSADDYAVVYRVKASQDEVDEMVEPDTYEVVVSFPGTGITDEVFELKIDKAEVKSVKANQDVYAWTGEAVKPDFTGYTGSNLTGTAVDLPNSGVGVKYEKAASMNPDGTPNFTGATTVSASNLKDEGWYQATVTVNSNNEHYQNGSTPITCIFQISKTAGFTDVEAGSWYAQSVYKAKELNYMNGIGNTGLFMPLADITRAEIAQTLYNMAGGSGSTGIYNPTKFEDVDPFAWYADAVAWATESGVVTGYDEVTFGPSDNATREQVAVMLYRYAKAQGKDVSVEDADAALAAYKDGDQVSDWAKTEMAWAVENGIFGVDTEELYPTENIQRAAVATIAVRVQPEALK